jgi:hypothetical protein
MKLGSEKQNGDPRPAMACGQFITPTNKFGVRKDLRSVEFWSLERDPGFTLVGHVKQGKCLGQGAKY